MGKASRAKRERRETGIDPRRERRPLPLVAREEDLPPLWNGEECEARRCVVIVGRDPERPDHWARELEGEQRRCVEVRVPIGGSTYPDFRDVPIGAVFYEHGGELHAYPEGVVKPKGARAVVVMYLDDEPKQPRPDEVAAFERQREQMEQSTDPAVRRMAKVFEPTVGYHGWAWQKVTKGRGSSRYGHREVPVAKLIGYIDGAKVPQIIEPEVELAEEVDRDAAEKRAAGAALHAIAKSTRDA